MKNVLVQVQVQVKLEKIALKIFFFEFYHNIEEFGFVSIYFAAIKIIDEPNELYVILQDNVIPQMYCTKA